MSLAGQADSRGTCYTPCAGCDMSLTEVVFCDDPEDANEYCAKEVGTGDCIPVVYNPGEKEAKAMLQPAKSLIPVTILMSVWSVCRRTNSSTMHEDSRLRAWPSLRFCHRHR